MKTHTAQAGTSEYRILPLASVHPSPLNPRKRFDQTELEELAASIRVHGIQQPIVVRSKGTFDYEIVCGERRYRAAQIAGLGEIPTVVRDLDDAGTLEIMILENNQRSDVHPLEEAAGFAALLDTKLYGEKREAVQKLAEKVGKSQRYVYDALKLFSDLAAPVREAFLDGKLTKSHAVLLSRLAHEDQEDVLEDIVDRDMSSRDLADWIGSEITLKLSQAPWALGDEKLLPLVGSCAACPKNSANDGLLMPDIEGAANGLCTDRECYHAKRQAFIERQVAEAREKSGTEPVLLKRSYDSDLPHVKPWEVTPVSPDTPGAVPAVCAENVAYANVKGSIGEVIYIAPPTPKPTDEEERAAREAREREKAAAALKVQIEAEFRQALFSKIVVLSDRVQVPALTPIALAIVDRVTTESQLEAIKALLPFEKEKGRKRIDSLKALAESNPFGVLAVSAFAYHLNPWKDEPNAALEQLAAAFGLDVPNIRMEIAAKLQPAAQESQPEVTVAEEAEPAVEAPASEQAEPPQAPAEAEVIELAPGEEIVPPTSSLQLGALWISDQLNWTFLITKLTKHKVWADCWDENGDQQNEVQCTRENFVLFRRPATPEEISGFQPVLAGENEASTTEPDQQPVEQAEAQQVTPYTWWRDMGDAEGFGLVWVTEVGDLVIGRRYLDGVDSGPETLLPEAFQARFRPATPEEFEQLTKLRAEIKSASSAPVSDEALPKVSDITGQVAPLFTILVPGGGESCAMSLDAAALAEFAAVNSLEKLMANPPTVLGMVECQGRRWIVVDVTETQVRLIPAVPRAEFKGVIRKPGDGSGVVGQAFEFEGGSYVAGQIKDRLILEVQP